MMGEFRGVDFRNPELGSGGMEGLQRKWVSCPGSSENATSEYKSESDTMAAFISEKCIKNTVAKVHTTKLFQSFKEWAKKIMKPNKLEVAEP